MVGTSRILSFRLVRGVCIPSLSDMLEKDGYGGYVYTPMKGQIMAPSHPASAPSVSSVREPSSVENLPMQSVASVGCGDSPPSCGKGEVSRNERTMFVTFSKGYPVSEMEVRQFFSRLLGNCIESFHMQEVKREEQSLYAKIVFLRPSFIGAILKGVSKAKFTINGKHIWMRKFVPRGNKQAP
ncbi:uncharacterized protein LOC121752040 isoform X3 [Salvia splendens]|uniref:uncharacterized protein LOC121752040 isoform X3 n=1 Tax=Salvia splendens TaxID=180675 RepID=UPI001C266F56|nr:uncharacterized protein LOC121752040 isoform X3 [Salvia splendens]